MPRTILDFVLVGLVLASVAQAAESAKHSGRIIAVDANGSTVTLEEMGPWRGPTQGVGQRIIRLTPSTRVELVGRVAGEAPDGWRGGFTRSGLRATDLRVGDYVTVTVARGDTALVATVVEVVRPPEAR